MNKSMLAGAIAHGGVGSDPAIADGCRMAVDRALDHLTTANDPLEAAIAGAMVLEDDPRFDAGTGSIVRLDGSIEMDASVMASDGRFGAVAGVERVRNPVLIARALLDTPHLLLIGDGANRFARALGMPDYDPTTPERLASTAVIKERLRQRDPSLAPFWRGDDWRARWNFPRSPEELGLTTRETGSDTIGVAVRSSDGRFGVALSTGGTAIVLRGRVGDVPIYGAGLFAGPHGAVASTGIGERIVEAMLASTTYGWLANGVSAQEAADRAIARFTADIPIGIIIITAQTLAAAATQPMAWAGRNAADEWPALSATSAAK